MDGWMDGSRKGQPWDMGIPLLLGEGDVPPPAKNPQERVVLVPGHREQLVVVHIGQHVHDSTPKTRKQPPLPRTLKNEEEEVED